MTMKKNRTICVISGGKDGIYAYQKVKSTGIKVDGLLNLINKDGRVNFHFYQKEIVKMQSIAMNLPVIQKKIIEQNKNPRLFEKELLDIFSNIKKNGINKIIFGYILPGDYQDRLLRNIFGKLGINLVLPNFKKNSLKIMRDIIKSGIRAIISAVDTRYIAKNWLGKTLDNNFLKYLIGRKNIDFCGDKGEYHTLVLDAPFFKKIIRIDKCRKIKISSHKFVLEIEKYHLAKKRM